MLLLVVMLLSNCSKLNFSKDSRLSFSLKPYGEEGQSNHNNINGVNKNKNVDYVIGGKESNSEKKDEKKTFPDISNINVDYSKAKTVLEIKEEERKAYEKEIKDWENQTKIVVDYSKYKNLLDFQYEEQKSKFERDKKLEEKKEYSTSNQNEYNSLNYGYEETIYGYERNFFC